MTFLLALLLTISVDGPTKASPVKVKAVRAGILTVDVTPPSAPTFRVVVKRSEKLAAGSDFMWDISPEDAVVFVDEDDPDSFTFEVPDGPEVEYSIKQTAKPKGGKRETLRIKVKVGSKPPDPPPDPPGPKPPGPQPPGPVIPAPIAEPGLHVLIKFDRDKFIRGADETSILFSESSTSVRSYLRSKCPAVSNGLGFRIYPVPAPGVEGVWKPAYDRSVGPLPTMTVSNGKTGWEGSIDGWSVEKVLAKIKEIEAAQ